MKTRLTHDEHTIQQQLARAYGLQVASLDFVPVGDSAYAYIVHGTNHERYFLKVFDTSTRKGRQSVARMNFYLPLTWSLYHERRFPWLTVPIRTSTGAFTTEVGRLCLVLFSFVEGENLMDAYPLSKELLSKIASALAKLHSVSVTEDLAAKAGDPFELPFLPSLMADLSSLEHGAEHLHVANGQTGYSDIDVVLHLRDIVRSHRHQIDTFIDRVSELQRRVQHNFAERGRQAGASVWVLCHGDVWGGNLVIHPDGHLVFLDWESACLAPRERDFTGFTGPEFDHFFASYQEHVEPGMALDCAALSFYCYRQQLSNLAQWVRNILHERLDEAQKQNDLDMICNHCLNRWDDLEDHLDRIRRRYGQKQTS